MVWLTQSVEDWRRFWRSGVRDPPDTANFSLWWLMLHVDIGLCLVTVKSFNFVSTNFRGLTTLDMLQETLIHGFLMICNITKVYKYFLGITNLWIALPTKYTKLNVQWILMELEHRKMGWKVLILKYDLGKKLSKEKWCKMAYTKKNLTTYFKRWKLHVIWGKSFLCQWTRKLFPLTMNGMLEMSWFVLIFLQN